MFLLFRADAFRSEVAAAVGYTLTLAVVLTDSYSVNKELAVMGSTVSVTVGSRLTDSAQCIPFAASAIASSLVATTVATTETIALASAFVVRRIAAAAMGCSSFVAEPLSSGSG